MNGNTKDVLIIIGIGCFILLIYNLSTSEAILVIFLIVFSVMASSYILFSLAALFVLFLNWFVYAVINVIKKKQILSKLN